MPCASSWATSRGWRVVTTQARHWYETDTQQLVEVTSPDNVLVSGQLASGAVASFHVAAAPGPAAAFGWRSTGGRHAGRDRQCLVAARRDAAPAGARGCHALSDLEVPERFVYVPADFLVVIRSTSGRCTRCSPRPSAPGRPRAHVRHRGGPAPLPRYHQAGVGDGPGAAGRLRRGRRPWTPGGA